MTRIFWAGDDESFQLVMQAQAKVEALQKQPGMTAGYIDDMIAKLPPIWRHEGNTAVIEVEGPLVQGSAGWMRLFGVLGYDDLAQAVVAAATDENTHRMLYHINTPGGDVAGITEMCSLLEQISAMKLSAKHTSDLCASAGYWMASAIKGQFTAGPVAIVGSIGVLQVHTEFSKMDAADGVTRTVLRAGEFKAEVNRIEPLTEGARARAQSQLADVHTMFRAQVAKGRPDLDSDKLAEVTEGQTFLGQKAVKAGLVDKVASFEQARKLLDTKKVPRDNLPNSKGSKAMAISLTPEQISAIAAGAPMQSFGLNADGSAMSAADITAYEAKVREDAAAKAALDAVDSKAKVEDTEDGAGGQGAPPADAGVLALLKEQVATANAKITELTVAATAHAAMTASHEGLLAIARSATANLLIPMGGSKAAVDGMDAAAIVAEHARVLPLFQARFPVGRQSSASDQDDKSKPKAALPMGFEYAVKNAPSANRK